jgi:hypothetical protein
VGGAFSIKIQLFIIFVISVLTIFLRAVVETRNKIEAVQKTKNKEYAHCPHLDTF